MVRTAVTLPAMTLALLLVGIVTPAQEATPEVPVPPNGPSAPADEGLEQQGLIIDDMEGEPADRWHDVYDRNMADLVRDDEIVREGLTSGRWEPETAARYIFSASIPHDWSGHEVLTMWIHSERASGARMIIILASDTPATEQTDFYRHVVDIDWEGWRQLRLTPRSFQVALQPAGWQKIDSIRFGFSGGFARYVPGTVLRFDAICVEASPPEGDHLLIFDSDSDWGCMSISGGKLDCVPDPEGSDARVARWGDTVLQTYVWNNAVPRDWSPYDYLNMWVYCEHPDEGEFMVWIESGNPATDRQDCYCTRIALDWQGWKLHTLPLQSLQVVREPLGWDQIGILKFYTAPYCRQGDGTALCFGDMWLSVEPPTDAEQ